MKLVAITANHFYKSDTFEVILRVEKTSEGKDECISVSVRRMTNNDATHLSMDGFRSILSAMRTAGFAD